MKKHAPIIKFIPTCNCGEKPGKKVILNNQAHVGITTEFQDIGVFKNNEGLYLENRFCPQCGAPRKVVEIPVEPIP
ncbi:MULTISPECIES: hypothetical protein [Caproicibacterium]|uniref:Uncharacterized protein n=1 Tax=Caproicibacterium argilliputei TaxID=3030016 RepID=A0AA97DB64_9FIRM|nr:hypothetical protein [Caproicibacterium argilliputei]WOC33027.1 hypothetical protein PXC00_03880 [Caproicibacterium argilliputei]